MKQGSSSEYLLMEEVRRASQQLKVATRGLSIGSLIKSIRKLLGMSQTTLAKRARVPQSTVSSIERGQRGASLSTLQKILRALSCDLVIAPLLQDSIENLRQKQAKKIARKEIKYLKGTMSLEKQLPDDEFVEILLKKEEENLLQDRKGKIWNE